MGEQVKVSLAFQSSATANLVRRKKVLSFKGKDSIDRVYQTISGQLGGPPLWPKDFGERLDNGDAAAQMLYCKVDSSADSPEWHAAPQDAILGDLVRGQGQDAVADLLLRLVEPSEVTSPAGEEAHQTNAAMYYSRTFLHFKEDAGSSKASLTPRALSDPVSCATPHSRVSEGVMSLSLVEQAELERKNRNAVEDYIQKRLQPLVRSRGASEQAGPPDERVRISRPTSSRSPLRILDQNLNMAPQLLPSGLRPARAESPAYLPASPPATATRLAAEPAQARGRQPQEGASPSNYLDAPLDADPRDPWDNGKPGDGMFRHIQDVGLAGAVPTPMQPLSLGMLQGGVPLPGGGGGGALPPANVFPDGSAMQPSVMLPTGSVFSDGVVMPPGAGLSPGGILPSGLLGRARANVDDDDSDDNMGYSHQVAGGAQGALSPAAAQAEELFDLVSKSDLAGVRRLLTAGADVNVCTTRGSHVLFRAVIKARDLDIVHLLLSARADARCRDEKGNQVMHFWARATVGRNYLLDMGRALVMAGADVNAQRFSDGMSPLHHVVVGHNNRRGWLDFHKALMLVRHGGNIHLQTHLGQLPLSLVSIDGRAATKQLVQLLQFGIYPGSGEWPRCDHAGCPWCS